MTVKACAVLAAVLAALTAGAADLQGYPAVVAVRGTDTVSLDDIAPRVLPLLAPLDAEKDRETIARIIRTAAEQQIFLRILQRKLTAAGISVSRGTAAEYIERRCRRFGKDAEALKKQLFRLVLQPDFQLKAALHAYFERYAPEMVSVSDMEIENFYRLNQKRFLAPRRIDAGVIAIDKKRPDARETAAAAAARLRQGEDFNTVAAHCNPEGSAHTLSPELVQQVKDPAAGRIYELEDRSHFAVIFIKSCPPPGYQPLNLAAPVIAEELSAAKISRAMQKLLTAELAAHPVKHAAPPSADAHPAADKKAAADLKSVK